MHLEARGRGKSSLLKLGPAWLQVLCGCVSSSSREWTLASAGLALRGIWLCTSQEGCDRVDLEKGPSHF